MRHAVRLGFAAVAGLLISGTAQTQPALGQVDADTRRAVVEAASEALRADYVYPDVGARAAEAIEAHLAAGDYDELDAAPELAARLTADLQQVTNDKHLRVFAPGPAPAPEGAATAPPPPNEAGVVRADRLPDNIGYVEIIAFPPLDAFKPAIDRAMAALADTRALIIDARRHGGGGAEAEAYLASYFLEPGAEPVAVNRFVWRNPGTETFRTQDFMSSPTPFSYAGKPVYVLISGRTFSGGEAIAYDMQALGLATLVGETTGGGAHPGGIVPVGAGFGMFVPGGRGENPITGTNWEGVGVTPDIAAPAADALEVALEQLGVSPRAADVDALSEARLFEPQVAAGPPGFVPTGPVVDSGSFYSPIVADLEQAVAFYRDGLGFEMQGEPVNADENQRVAMFGLPDARIRWLVGLAPGAPGGVEIVEVSGAGSRPTEWRMQDPGAVMLMVVVRDLDATLARLKRLGAPVVTTGGAPVIVGIGPGAVQTVVVRDPAGHFVELVQPGMLPPAPEGSNANIAGVRVRHTVENLERALALYRDALGLRGRSQIPPYAGDQTVLDLLGLPHDERYRFTMLTVPSSGLGIELIEFEGARRRAEPADLATPGSTRIELRVSDIDAAASAITEAGGTLVSGEGTPLDVRMGDATVKAATVRDPDGLFLTLIQAPASQ